MDGGCCNGSECARRLVKVRLGRAAVCRRSAISGADALDLADRVVRHREHRQNTSKRNGCIHPTVQAALAERNGGGSPFSIGLLIDAAQKERESLEAIEQSIETLRLSLDQRRRAIDQQEEILRDLSDSLTQERTQKNATRR